jgi:putative membrane protein
MLFATEPWSAASFEMSLLAAAAFGLLGIAMMAIGFKVFEWITPKLKIEEELGKGNVAVGIVAGAAALGMSLIIVRAIGG